MKKSELVQLIKEVISESKETQLYDKSSIISVYFDESLNKSGVRFHNRNSNESIALSKEMTEQLYSFLSSVLK